ncbi:MAG: PHP domain-containing protein, partial [Shewanella sp.]|nr:PHP domain-containing protein [Shewanella sp.]
MSQPRFVHLRCHSDFSMVDGLTKIKPILGKIEELGMPAFALTDQNNLCGLVKFYSGCHDKGIKPIIGADFNMMVPGFEKDFCSLTVLAMNNPGYQNLTDLISRAYLRGHVDDTVVIDQEWLIEYGEGILLLGGGKDGDIGKALLKGNMAQANSLAEFYRSHFDGRYYLELLRTGRPDEERYLHAAVAFAQEQELPVVATNQVVFLTPREFEAHEIRVAIHDGYTLADPRRPKQYSDQQYLKSEQEMCDLFADIPEALENTVEIAKRCNVTVRLGEYFLPN